MNTHTPHDAPLSLKSLLPTHPHNAIICGKTRSGKTYQMLNIIEKYYPSNFNNIFIICPTFDDNKTYNRPWLKGVKIYPGEKLVETLEMLIKAHSKGGKLNGKKSLIIIDDCSADQDLNKHRTALSKVAFSGRHASLTTWFLTQRYISVPKDFRENIDWLLITKNTCKRSFETMTSENDIIPGARLGEIKSGLVNTYMLFMNVDQGKYLLLSK